MTSAGRQERIKPPQSNLDEDEESQPYRVSPVGGFEGSSANKKPAQAGAGRTTAATTPLLHTKSARGIEADGILQNEFRECTSAE